MCRLGEFDEQFSDQAPILAESLDNATAFFLVVDRLIRATPAETWLTMHGKPLLAAPFDRPVGHIRGIIRAAVSSIAALVTRATPPRTDLT
jgi:hypothetical protein